MLWWSWGTWPDVLIDFGRELYVAWQLAEGKILYSDIAYFNGPLSPYVNALWFRLFGASVLTLSLCNLVILTVLIIGLYHLLSEVSDRLAASTACVTFVTIFAFAQLDAIGNYNYVSPYSHEMTHGLTLSVGALLCLSSYLRAKKPVYLAGAGLALGLIFLTKAEIFLAAALAVIVGFGLAGLLERSSWPRVGIELGTLVAAALVPPLVAFVLFGRAIPPTEALRGVLGSWLFVFNQELTSLTFYRRGMGTLNLGASLERIALWAAVYAAIFLPAVALCRRPKKRDRRDASVILGLFVAVAITHGIILLVIYVEDAVAPLPVFLSVLVAATGLALFRHRRDPQFDAPLILRLALNIFSLVLLGKMFFNAQLVHYGFALAMPGTLLAVVTIVGVAPDQIDKRGGRGGVFRAAGLAVVLVTIAFALYIVHLRFSHKQVIVAQGADAFVADFRGEAVNSALEDIKRRIRPGESLAVLPEGVMLNYLARIGSPTPHVNFMPPELIMFGEAHILKSLRAHPPDYIALVHKDTREYGFQFFGRDYGQRIFAWILDNYQGVRLIGALPLLDHRFGILLLKRTTPER